MTRVSEILEYTSRTDVYNEIERDVRSRLILKRTISGPRKIDNLVWDATELPTESHYAPVYVQILKELEEKGEIDPQTHTLVETTTGNAGAAFGYIAGKLGYSVIVFMPEDMPENRINNVRSQLTTNESSLILTPAKQYVKGMVESFQNFFFENRKNYKGKKLFAVNHSRRPTAITAIESSVRSLFVSHRILNIDYAVLALGNGTSSTGAARVLKSMYPNIHIIGVEPEESPWCYSLKYRKDKAQFEQSRKTHSLYGTGGWGVDFPNLDLNLIDEIKLVNETSWKAKLESLLKIDESIGHSTAACRLVVDDLPQGTCAFSILYDNYKKY